MDRGAWQATGPKESDTTEWLSLSFSWTVLILEQKNSVLQPFLSITTALEGQLAVCQRWVWNIGTASRSGQRGFGTQKDAGKIAYRTYIWGVNSYSHIKGFVNEALNCFQVSLLKVEHFWLDDTDKPWSNWYFMKHAE